MRRVVQVAGDALVIAAGGGGDAITGAALAGLLPLLKPAVVMTYSWDRLMVDPLPGPRSADDFAGLDCLAPGVLEVVPATTAIAPAASSLPRLSAELPARLLLLDPADGVVGATMQIRSAAEFFGAGEIALVDVGGDVLTTGTDPGLRSPLADQLALAACVCTGLPARLLIAAPGIDGEIPAETVLARLRMLAASELPPLTEAHIGGIRDVFRWHPSEASGLLAAAASGRRGVVEVRDAGDQVTLTAATATVFSVSAKAAMEVTPAAQLTESRSLTQAESIVRGLTGISELRYETKKAQRLRDRRVRSPKPIRFADRRQVRSRGARPRCGLHQHASSLGTPRCDNPQSFRRAVRSPGIREAWPLRAVHLSHHGRISQSFRPPP